MITCSEVIARIKDPTLVQFPNVLRCIYCCMTKNRVFIEDDKFVDTKETKLEIIINNQHSFYLF